MTNRTWDLPSVRELVSGYAAGTLSPVEVVTAAIRAAEAAQPNLHPMVELRAEAALAEAAAVERTCRDSDARGALCGVPVVVKDIVDVAGLPTRCGSPSRDDAPTAAADAPAVRAWRDAGAIVIGKSVTQEFAAGVLSPPARNPWDPDRIPGGSSGGSAVAVAIGAASIGLGSDTGGSIRIPSAAVGATGFKPTFGSVSTAGCYPLSWSLDTVGPLARSVDDVEAGWRALVGDSRFVPADEPPTLAGVRVGLALGYFVTRVQQATLSAVEDAASALRSLGAEVVPVDWADSAVARDCGYLLNRTETGAAHAATYRNEPERFSRMNPELQLRVIAGLRIPSGDYLLAKQARTRLRDSMARLFADQRLDALLAPTLPDVAVRADDPTVRIGESVESAGIAYTRLAMPFNATGQPVLAFPVGFDPAGLPIGAQLAGRPGNEVVLFRVGRAYQRATDWHRRRPPFGTDW